MSEKTEKISDELNKEYNALTNTFPIEVFPKSIQDYITENVKSLGFNQDHLCCSVLSAFATAFGNMYHLNVKDGFVVKPIFWIIICGKAGDGKSHVMNLPFKAIRQLETKYRKDFELALKEHETNPDSSIKPKCKDIMMNDFTLESLLANHKINERGLCMFSDETMSFVNSFSRYSSSSQENNYLTMWNGNNVKISRISGGTYNISEVCINHLSGIQRSRIAEMYKGDRAKSGFLDRFLFCNPQTIRLNSLNNNHADPLVNKNFEKIFQRIFENYDTHELYKLIPYSPDSFNLACNFSASILERHIDNGDIFTSMARKLETYYHRFALTMELIDCYANDKIIRQVTLSSTEKAELITKYFENTGKVIRESTNDPKSKINGKELQLYNSLPNQFITSQALNLNESIGVSEPTIKRYLKNGDAYVKQAHGKYTKVT